MNSINWTQVRHDVTETIKHEALECTKRVVSAVAIAAFIGLFGLHVGAIGTAPLFWLARTVCTKAAFFAINASIQYLVERVASKILNACVKNESLIARVIKAVVPFLISISASFAFIYSWGQFNGFPLGWKINEEESFWIFLEFKRLDSWKDAFSLANIYPSNMANLDYMFTWEFKILSEAGTMMIEGASCALKTIASSAHRTYVAAKNYFQNAA